MAVAGPLAAAVALLLSPAAAAAQTAGGRAARAGLATVFVPGDVAMLVGGAVAMLLFGAVLNRLTSVLSARSAVPATLSAPVRAGVAADHEVRAVADSRPEVSGRTAAAA